MIPLARPDLGDEEVAAAAEVLRSGNLVQGLQVSEFETACAKYLDIPHVVAVSSGTSALHLALMALGIGPGDEVIVPDFTFPATANVVELCGATPVLCDIDLPTLNIDVAQIEKLITPKTKAIMPVHEFGCPADMGRIVEIAQRRDLKVVEDAACALGTDYQKKKVGTIGDIGCFSLHPRKAITTGEGGLVACRSAEIAEKIKVLRNHGIVTRNGKIDFACAGFNYRMTDIQAAIGRVQMRKLESLITRRREIVAEYTRLLKGSELMLPSEPVHGRHVYQTFHVVLPNGIDRDEVIRKLKEQEIGSNYGASALNCLQHHSRFANGRRYPQAETAYKRGLALPLFASMTSNDIARVCEVLLSLVQGA